jgi:hypothetical protein
MPQFKNIEPMSRESIQIALQSNDAELTCNALLAAVYFDPDWQWAQELCLQHLEDKDINVCALAATCLGHIARIHRRIDKSRVLGAIEAKMVDEKIKGILEDVVDDINSFVVDPI